MGVGNHPVGREKVNWLKLNSEQRSARVNHPVGREKVNWTAGPREAGLGHDSARHSIGIRLERRNQTARALRAGTRPARPHCAQEGRHLRFLPSCESPLFPSGRAARVKALSRLADATHLPKQHEGAKCHPVGARSARPSRPPCSDRREGRCHPGGVLLNRASARFFVPRCSAQNDKKAVIPRCVLSSVILRCLLPPCHPEERSDEGSRACA